MSGKGSKPRPFSVSRQTFSENWDLIFNKNEDTETISLKSEINELKHLISKLPEDHLLERMSLESRLEFVRKKLGEI